MAAAQSRRGRRRRTTQRQPWYEQDKDALATYLNRPDSPYRNPAIIGAAVPGAAIAARGLRGVPAAVGTAGRALGAAGRAIGRFVAPAARVARATTPMQRAAAGAAGATAGTAVLAPDSRGGRQPSGYAPGRAPVKPGSTAARMIAEGTIDYSRGDAMTGAPATYGGRPLADPAVAAAGGQFDAEPPMPTLEYATPDYSALDAYYSQYEQSMKADYDRALAAIAAQQGIAQQNLAQYPSLIQQNYQGAQNAMDAYAQNLMAAQQQSGLQPFGPAEAGLQPFQSAMQMSQASYLNQQPFLQQGADQMIGNQRGQLESVYGEMQRDLAMQRAEAAARRAELEAELQNRQRELEYESAMDMYRRERYPDPNEDPNEWYRRQMFEEELLRERMGYENELVGQRERREEQGERLTYGTHETSYDRGEDIARYQGSKAKSIRSKSAYTYARDRLRAEGETALPDLKKRFPGQPQMLSLAMFDAGLVPAE